MNKSPIINSQSIITNQRAVISGARELFDLRFHISDCYFFAGVFLCLCAFIERPFYAKQTQFSKNQKDVSNYILRAYENNRVFGRQKNKAKQTQF